MKNAIKFSIFIIGYILLYIGFSYLFLPKENLHRFGMYKTSMYEILGEKKNTVDTIVLGDSLVYSAFSPMEIYKEKGYTVFDCTEAGLVLEDAYDYLKIANESQNIKVLVIEPNFFFRDVNKRPKYKKPIKVVKNKLPLLLNHNNWKKILFKKKYINSWTNPTKGYKKNTFVNSSHKFNYMKRNKASDYITEDNYKQIKRIVDYCDKNDIKIVLMSVPSQKCYNDKRVKKINEIAKKYKIDYINLNKNDEVKIDWEKETKDQGDHLNYYGAKKVSKYLANQLEKYKLTNHKNQKGYEEWDRSLKFYFDSEKNNVIMNVW